MRQYKVIVSRLNVRKAPVSDFKEKNVITTVGMGKILELDEVLVVPNPSLGKWYTDGLEQYYSGTGLQLFEHVAFADLSLPVPWWISQLGIDTIWKNYNEKGKLAKVAVIDTGYNISNPEISKGVTGTYLHPSFVGKTTINDNDGHGSYCSSIIGARNLQNIIGCAPECELYISKMSDSNGYNKTKLNDAIEDAILHNVDIISISVGGIPFAPLQIALQKAIAKNIIVLASIGNNGGTVHIDGGEYPALYPECLAVGSSDKDNKISLVTLNNPKTEINAPGEEITGYALNAFPQKYGTSTSAATAVAAGICALVISYCKQHGKNYSYSLIKDLILNNCDASNDALPKKIISPTKIFNQLQTI